MALESGTYISDLVPTNPVHTDGVNQADSHLRLIKSALQATFPNIKGAVTATHTLLNAVTTALGTAGSLILTGAPSLTLTNVAGVLTSSGPFTAPALRIGTRDVGTFLIPSGAVIIWNGIPSSIPSGWVLCDGTNNTPDLRDKFIIGAGGNYNASVVGGSTSATTSTQGAHTHSGATGAAGAFSASVLTDTQGTHSHGGSTQGYSLGIADIPSHTHAQAQSVQASVLTGSNGITMNVTSINGQYAVTGPYTAAAGNGNAHSHTIGSDGAHSHNVTLSQGSHTHTIGADGSHSHTVATMPPYFALCYIMKV